MCVGVCSIIVEQDSAACICEGVLKKSRNQQCRLGHETHNNSKRKVVCAGEKDQDDKKHQKRRSSVFVKNLAPPKETVMKNMSGNTYSTNNSLAHPEEMLDNETLQATTHSGHNGRRQAIEQTEMTCAMSQAERIFNMCEIGYGIHISLNFSFKFGGIILILFDIKLV